MSPRFDTLIANKTIAINTDTSEEFIISGYAMGMIQLPAAMTGTTLDIEVKNADDGTFYPVYESGAQLTIAFVANTYTRIPDGVFGAYAMRFVSDATELAARTISVRLQA